MLKIGVFVLPHEIDMYEHILVQLKRNSNFVKEMKVTLDVTFCVSDELTDWSKSVLPKQFFIDKFNSLARYTDWCTYKPSIEDGSTILGCVSKRRDMVELDNDELEAYMWLDCDMIFPEKTLGLIEASLESFRQAGVTKYVLTPQLVRIWDATWDILVNDHFLNRPLKYNYDVNPFEIQDLQLIPPDIIEQREFKFAGGWVTVISKDALNQIGIPDELGHYGQEDMYAMVCFNFLASIGEHIRQYTIKNLIVCENLKYRDESYYTKYIARKNRQEEFRAIANANLNSVIVRFVEKNQKGTI